jgi:hypothetical protein
MRQGHGFDEVFIKGQTARYATGNLRNFKRMCKPSAKIITLVVYKNLCFVLEPPEGCTMDNPVTITTECRSLISKHFLVAPPTALIAAGGIWSKVWAFHVYLQIIGVFLTEWVRYARFFAKFLMKSSKACLAGPQGCMAQFLRRHRFIQNEGAFGCAL